MSTHGRLTAIFLSLMLSLVLCGTTLFGQAPEEPRTPEIPQSPAEPQAPSGDAQSVPEEQPSPQEQPSPAIPDTKITPAELQQLRESIDALLTFASEQSGLPIRSKVHLELRSRADVNRFLEERMKDNKDAARLEQSELVMKKLGLLPRDFNLRKFIVRAYSEQVAGYYDAKTRTMCLLDWVPFDEQRPVMAHELTHALQDQRMPLDTWLLADSAVAKNTSAAQRDAALDELRLARSSVAEGQGMVVLWNYNLLPIGRTVEDAEDLITAFTSTMLDAKGSPEMSAAPLYIKRGLIFPYREGFEFVRQVLIKRGKAGAFGGILDKPPVSSREIMQPTAYLRSEEIPQLKVPNFGRLLGREWTPADFGAIGQIDLDVMLQLYQDEKMAKALSPQWRGGYYYAARKRHGKDAQLALVYVSRWADKESANRFKDIYAASWKKRYKNARDAVKGNVPDLSAADTEEGSVSVARRGDVVVAIESFPETEATKVRRASFAANSASRENVAVVPIRLRPALDLSAYLRTAILSRVAAFGRAQAPKD